VRQALANAGSSEEIINAGSFEKQEAMKAKEDDLVFANTGGTVDRKTSLMRKILSITTEVSTLDESTKEDRSKKLKDRKTKVGSIESRNPSKTVSTSSSSNGSYNIFEEKTATIKLGASLVSKKVRKAKDKMSRNGTGMDAKIDAIEEVIMISADPNKKQANLVPTNNVAHVKASEMSSTMKPNRSFNAARSRNKIRNKKPDVTSPRLGGSY
jgi:hypothetical protein